MEGCCPVEDLVRWGFAHAPVVMANEAHNGLARCIRTLPLLASWDGVDALVVSTDNEMTA